MDNPQSFVSPMVWQRLQNRLRECRILHHLPVRSCDDVVRVVSVPLHCIAKSMVLKANAEPTAVIAVIPGDKRLSLTAVERLAECGPLRLAKAGEVLALTGMPLGAVSPLGMPPEVCVVIDQALASASSIYCGTGNNESSLVVAGSTLVEVTGAVVGYISE